MKMKIFDPGPKIIFKKILRGAKVVYMDIKKYPFFQKIFYAILTKKIGFLILPILLIETWTKKRKNLFLNFLEKYRAPDARFFTVG